MKRGNRFFSLSPSLTFARSGQYKFNVVNPRDSWTTDVSYTRLIVCRVSVYLWVSLSFLSSFSFALSREKLIIHERRRLIISYMTLSDIHRNGKPPPRQEEYTRYYKKVQIENCIICFLLAFYPAQRSLVWKSFFHGYESAPSNCYERQ